MIAATHPVSPEEVMALADGELSGAEASAIAAHIAECPECASLAAKLEATSVAFAKWSVPDAPARLEEAVSAVAAQNGKTAPGPHSVSPGSPHGFNLWKWNAWVIYGTGALTVILIVVAMNFSTRASYKSALERRDLTYLDATDASGARVATDIVTESRSSTGDAVNQPLPAPPPHVSTTEGYTDAIEPSDKRVAPSAGIVAYSYDTPSSRARNTKALEAKSSAPAPAAAAPVAPMIAHSVALTVQVRDLGASRTALETLLARHRGYAAQLTVNTAEGSPRNLESSLRVPDTELAAAIGEMRALGRVETETQSGEEVTQQHADLVARLQNSREAEQRLRELLAQHTGKIDDVLQVEEEISRVRGEIEQMEADQKVLEHRVDFATIELQLTEQYREQLGGQSASVPMQIRNAFVAGLRHGAATLLGILLFLEEAGPTALIWLAILAVPGLLLWRRYRRIRAKI
jgi:hypothetical protein